MWELVGNTVVDGEGEDFGKCAVVTYIIRQANLPGGLPRRWDYTI